MEERILERATQKLKLDQLVIQEGRAQTGNKGDASDDCGRAIAADVSLFSSRIQPRRTAGYDTTWSRQDHQCFPEVRDILANQAARNVLMRLSMTIDQDIDEIILRGQGKTAELNSKYADFDLDALNNFKSESLVNTWEGEEFSHKVSWSFHTYVG